MDESNVNESVQADQKKTKPESSMTDKPTTTLFVSNLAQSIDSAKLLELSSALGPVKEAFVVSDPATSKSRGFGYVQFVLREDAQTALQDGFQLDQDIQQQPLITWAKPKLTPEQRELQNSKKNNRKNNPRKQLKPVTPVAQQTDSPTLEGEPSVQLPADSSSKQKNKNQLAQTKKDPFGNRIVVLQGLPIPPTAQGSDPTTKTEAQKEAEEAQSEAEGDEDNEPTSALGKSVSTKALYKKAKKLGRLESVKYPVLFPPSQSSASAHLIFADPTSAAIAQQKLHGHVFKGHYLTTAIKSRHDALTRLGHAFGGRLIIRNLQFDITEKDLRFLFAPFGPIHSIDIPAITVEAEGKPSSSRGRGFGFVWMLNQEDAKKAIDGLNGKKVYSGICLEAIRKEIDGDKKSVKRKREKAGEPNAERGRMIAVDWALGKQKYEESQAVENLTRDKDQEKASDDDDDDDDASDSGSSGSDDDDDDNESHSGESSTSETNTSSSVDEDQNKHEMDDDSEEAKDNQNANEGTTLFVRNLSFEATEQELHKLFRPFGPIRYARIVMDHTLGRSRGTGFVCLWNKEDAQKVLDLVKKLESEGAGHGPLAANGLPSLLQPDSSSSLASQLSLHGRILGVSEAVSRDRAEKLRIDRDKRGAGKDKRRLYLMREGVIFPNSNEAKHLHPADLAARQQSFDQRKALLRSNLSLFISYTRLSIRQLPLYVSERSLKRLARYALDQWRKEVKAGTRAELTEEELEREPQAEPTHPSTQDDKTNEAPSKKERKKKKGIESKVKQVKILRTNDRIDGTTGLGKSKGYGFLELETHQNALRVLRWANANPTVDRLLKEWTIEEIQSSINKSESGGKDDASKESHEKKFNKDEQAKKSSHRVLGTDQIKKLKTKLSELQAELDSLNKWSSKKQKTKDENTSKAANNSHIKPHRMLIIEFAVENAQTVKKRSERKDKTQRGTKDGFKKKEDGGQSSKEEEGGAKGPTKKDGRSSTKRKGDDQDRNDNKLGRIISLKRKSKKLKKQ